MMPDHDTPEPAELTEEQRARMEAYLNAHPYGEQDENGIDLSLLRRNLKLTPSQRWNRHASFARSVQGMLHAAGRA